MSEYLIEIISKQRLLMENPYAYLDGEGGFVAILASSDQKIDSVVISEDRLLKENPYAHLDGEGNFDATLTCSDQNSNTICMISPETIRGQSLKYSNRQNDYSYSNSQIEAMAIRLQRLIWKKRNQIWSGNAPLNPVDILNPEVALKSIGYSFSLNETLGQYSKNNKTVEVAGTIDSELKEVRISRRFMPNIRNFTAAHELGHAILHKANGLHRDRPMDVSALKTPHEPVEAEANKFATYFLMPKKLVKKEFEKIFLTECFTLNEDTLFAFASNKRKELKQKHKTLHDVAKVLASTEYYNGYYIDSLASQFHVSIEAMAIRIEELGLLEL